MKFCLTLLCLSIVASPMAQTKDSLLSGVHHWNELKAAKLEGKTLALDYFNVQVTTLQPGKAHLPPHTHQEQDELLIVKEGSVKVTVNGTSKVIGPGSIAFFMADDQHGIENAGNTPAVCYMLTYAGKQSMDVARSKQAGGSIVLNLNDLKTSNTGKGYRRDYFNRATSQVPQFEMHTTALNAGEISHPPHTHVQEEVILVLRGQVEMQLGDRMEKGTVGDLYFVSSNVPHNLKNIGNEQCEYFAFQWRN